MTEWTLERRKLATDHYLSGRSPEWIASEMGSTAAAVKMALSRWDVKRPVSLTGQAKPPRRQELKDIARRRAVLLGLEPRPVAPRRTIPDEDLMRYGGESLAPEAIAGACDWDSVASCIERVSGIDEATDEDASRKVAGFLAFGRELIGVEPQPHQIAMAYLMLASRNVVSIIGRQGGKDWLIGLLLVWESVAWPNRRSVIVSEAQRQSDWLCKESVMNHIARSPEVFDCVARPGMECLSFLNQSEIYFLPSTGAIRGLTSVTRAIVNEALNVPDESYPALEPMLARLHGSLSLFSTPGGRVGKLWEYYNNPMFSTMRLPSSVNTYLPHQHLEDQALKMHPDDYRREYEAEFSDVSGAFFSTGAVDACRKDYAMRDVPEEGKIYAIGWDPATAVDASVMEVVSKDASGVLRLEALRSFLGVSFPEQLTTLHGLARIFRPSAIVVEYVGVGLGPTQDLEAMHLGYPVVRFNPSATKAEAYGNLKSVIERGHIALPASETHLATELKFFQFKRNPSGSVSMGKAPGGSDDEADALCFACWALRGTQGDVGLAGMWEEVCPHCNGSGCYLCGRTGRSVHVFNRY